MVEGDRRALARLFTMLDQDRSRLAEVMKAVHPHESEAHCIGLTGLPGAGKSTIADGLVGILRKAGKRVGVLAVDPSSPHTGGAVLGDRVRMQRHYLDEGVFIRSLASRGVHGGLSRITGASIRLLQASGHDAIIVETVGVGQTELDVMRMADTVVVTLMPEAGDAVQAMKAGLMEIADIFVVNKADREGADRMAADIEASLSLGGGEAWWSPPVVSTRANVGEGIDALYESIASHREALASSSHLERRRRERRAYEMALALREAVEEEVGEALSADGALRELTAQVERGDVDPYSAAARAAAEYRGR